MRDRGTGKRDQGSGIRDQGRKGSALLIVLGMLAFIVASAVAFSAYMRYARMPSSYLRRTSSSRLLAKAALAEAIDVIDTSIGNDLFPGQKGRNFVKTYRRITDDENNGADVIDYWQDRCFIGSNTLVNVDSTVSTLCTEALAYIPPPIINEVRYYSRRSVGAMWHTLGFDSGRFAFTAVDVSDFFDVNSVCATPLDIDGQHMYGRNSSDTGRITLAHVFENPQHTGYTYQPDDWDAFMDNYLDSGKLPLVSVADLNLAMNKQGLPVYMSPFCNYIRSGANFVTSDSAADPEVNLVRNMAFVTDGLFAITNRPPAPRSLDISRRKDQPFHGHERGVTVQELIAQENSDFRRRLDTANSPFFNQCEIVQLYDYLDEDSVPLSLALPTVERTPMITGVALGGDLNVVVTPKDCEKVSADGTAKYSYRTYTLKLVGSLDANVGAVYPFKYDRGASASYQMEAVATIAFVPSCKPEEGLLRCSSAAAPGVVTLENGNGWSVNSSWETAAYSGNKPSVARRKTASKQVSLPTSVKTDSDTVIDDVNLQFGSLNLEFVSDLPASEFCNPEDLKCTFRSPAKKMTKDPANPGSWIPDPAFVDPTPLADRLGWLPVKEDLSGVVADAALVGQTFTPTVQVWVRIYTGGNTVDLVPACWKDDKSPSEIIMEDARGTTHYPMLRFRGVDPDAVGATLANDSLTGNGAVDFYPKAYIADDPRFNFAPENFEALGAQEAPFDQLWLTRARASADASDGRDGDIFMATSDAGYLQSVYELSYILQVSPNADGFGAVDGSGYNGKAGSMPAKAAMWRTYSQYDNGSSSGEIDYLDIINGSRGFRVNPYTPSKDIMLAALANSPLDWWSASTNKTVNTKVHDSATTAQKYSFSKMSGAQVQLEHANLEAIAEKMIGAFRGSNGDWRQEFDRLGWDDDADTLCGVKLDNGVKLHSVDRKFLHGFWKESIANRQQLFLIFVRAEPMMMGGGGLGQTPPQLGARAVALVWRDPTKTADDVAGFNTSGGPRPHRTRILFYRQFD